MHHHAQFDAGIGKDLGIDHWASSPALSYFWVLCFDSWDLIVLPTSTLKFILLHTYYTLMRSVSGGSFLMCSSSWFFFEVGSLIWPGI